MHAPSPAAQPLPASTPSALSVSDSLTIHSAQDQCAAWMAELRQHEAVSLDLSGVKACDALGIQLLLALRRSAAEAGKAVAFVRPSEVLQRAALAVGCPDLFSPTLPQ